MKLFINKIIKSRFSFWPMIGLSFLAVFCFLYLAVTTYSAVIYESKIASAEKNTATADPIIDFKKLEIGKTKLPKDGKFVIIDSLEKKVFLFRNGTTTESFKIINQAASSSQWGAMNGEYDILNKEEKHFSPIAKVFVPYAINFFGNALIHGLPYRADGKKISPSQAINSFKLSDPDAKKVFEFADDKTKVLVFGAGERPSWTNYFSYVLHRTADFLPITAGAYLVTDLESKEVIISKNKDLPRPIASVTKLMTALISLETINQNTISTVSRNAHLVGGDYGKTGRLRVGDKLPVGKVLYPLLLTSSNEASEVIAETAGRDIFIKRMNDKAKALGMNKTHYDDPSGLSAKNVSTAEDLAKLAAYIFENKKEIMDITKVQTYHYGRYFWSNNSNLAYMSSVVGGKIGYTEEANRTQLALVDLPLSEFDKRTLSVVLLYSNDRKGDTNKILNFLSKYVSYNGRSALAPSAHNLDNS